MPVSVRFSSGCLRIVQPGTLGVFRPRTGKGEWRYRGGGARRQSNMAAMIKIQAEALLLLARFWFLVVE